MMLLTILPDWNSLDSVRHTHSDLELAGLVFFALLVVAEALAHSTQIKKREHLFDTFGIWFFAIAVICEIVGYPYGQRNDELSAQVIVSLDAKAQDASDKADHAKTTADGAKIKSDAAGVEAAQAGTSAATAFTMAGNARREADSFEAKITSAENNAASAETKAADAESHLADALQKAAQAEEELKRIRSPRSISNVSALVAVLKPLKGTEYRLKVFQDDEAIQFTKVIDDVLQQAGWVRKQEGVLHLGITSINIFSSDIKDSVPVCLETGIQIHVRSTQSLQTLLATAPNDLPKTILSASTLRGAFQPFIAPSDERNVGDKVILDEANPGEGPILICAGKKP
jgi:hypothetical protein